MDRRKIDCVVSSILVVVAIIILTNNNLVEGGVESSLGSMTLPRIVASFMLVISSVIGCQAFWNLLKGSASEDDTVNTKGFFSIALYIAIFVCYWWLLPSFGFLICTPLMMLAIAALLACDNWKIMAAVSVAVPLIIFYGSRHFLYVYLPTLNIG